MPLSDDQRANNRRLAREKQDRQFAEWQRNNPSTIQVEDHSDRPVEKKVVQAPLSESFGYDLDTIEKARQWLTNPQNWFRSDLFILRWDGLVPRISERHGQRLIDEPWDDGLPRTVVYGQKQRRMKKEKGEEIDEKEEKGQQDE